MIEDLEELLKQVSDPADMAVLLLAGTAGFVADAGLNVIGFLSPGVVGIAAATSALGVKRSVDAWRQRRLRHRAERSLAAALRLRVKIVQRMLTAKSVPSWIGERLDAELELYEAGVTSIDELSYAVDEAVEWLRRREVPADPSGRSRPPRGRLRGR